MSRRTLDTLGDPPLSTSRISGSPSSLTPLLARWPIRISIRTPTLTSIPQHCRKPPFSRSTNRQGGALPRLRRSAAGQTQPPPSARAGTGISTNAACVATSIRISVRLPSACRRRARGDPGISSASHAFRPTPASPSPRTPSRFTRSAHRGLQRLHAPGAARPALLIAPTVGREHPPPRPAIFPVVGDVEEVAAFLESPAAGPCRPPPACAGRPSDSSSCTPSADDELRHHLLESSMSP